MSGRMGGGIGSSASGNQVSKSASCVLTIAGSISGVAVMLILNLHPGGYTVQEACGLPRPVLWTHSHGAGEGVAPHPLCRNLPSPWRYSQEVWYEPGFVMERDPKSAILTYIRIDQDAMLRLLNSDQSTHFVITCLIA